MSASEVREARSTQMPCSHCRPAARARSSFGIAAVHACLGEKDAAFEWLERAFHERAAWLVFLKVAGFFATLHGDPRFDSLVKRIGIPD